MGPNTPIIDTLLPFLDYCEIEKGLSNNTQRNYRQYLQLFMSWLKKTGNEKLKPGELTAQHVWDYRLYIAREYVSPLGKYLAKKSQNYYLIALRSLLDFYAERDITSLPSSKIKLAKQKSDDHISFLEMHEVERMLELPDAEKPEGMRDRAIMETFFSSGMRISELVSLNTGMLGALFIKGAPPRTIELSIVGKGKYVRTVFISPRACEWIKKYLSVRKDEDKAVFVNISKNGASQRLTPRSIQRMIGKYAMLAGLAKKVTPHTLRHTYATDLLSHGADLRSVQELLGHKNVATTQIYTHVTNKRLRDIHEKFHGGQEGKDK